LPLPVGLVYDEDGQVLLDPDEEVRTAIVDIVIHEHHPIAAAADESLAAAPGP
jgi:hypothetical protein